MQEEQPKLIAKKFFPSQQRETDLASVVTTSQQHATMEDPELDDEFDEDDEQEDLDFLSEPSTSLSIGHDTLHHLMPPPFVPTLCMRLLRLESRENNNSSDPPWSVRSTRPPPQPHNHGFHTDEVLLPANRPENFIDPNHIFFKTQPPTQPIQRQPVQPVQPTQPTRPQQPQRIIHTHRHVRPSTTDPGTLTARHANPNVPSTHNIARQRPSSTSATHRKRPTRKTKPQKHWRGPLATDGWHVLKSKLAQSHSLRTDQPLLVH